MIQGSKIWFLRVFNPMESKNGIWNEKQIAHFCPQNWAKIGHFGGLGLFGGPLWGIQGPNRPLGECHCVHFIILVPYKTLKTIPVVTWTLKKSFKKNFCFLVPGARTAENGSVLLAQNVTEF